MASIIFVYLCILITTSGLILAHCNWLIKDNSKRIAKDNQFYFQEACRIVRDRRSPVLT